MHAIRFHSVPQLIAGLVAKRNHGERRAVSKPEQRRRKADRRDFRDEVARCIWPAFHEGVEL